jgi:hypothetical protein
MNNEIYIFLIEFYKGLGEIYIREHEKRTERNNLVYNIGMCCRLHLSFIEQFHHDYTDDVRHILHHSYPFGKEDYCQQTDELVTF